MSSEYALKEYYVRYLKNIRCLSNTTVEHYLEALKNISGWLQKKGLIRQHIFEVMDIETLQALKETLYMDPDFEAQDKRGHQMGDADVFLDLRR